MEVLWVINFIPGRRAGSNNVRYEFLIEKLVVLFTDLKIFFQKLVIV
jgi:hypothetical protein